MVQNIELGVITPPYGVNLFIMKGMLPDTSMGVIFRSVLWFIVPLLVTMFIYIAFPQVVFTHAGVPDDVVYAMTKAMYEGKAAMAATFPPFKAFNPKDMKGDPGVAQFHPGALRFYKEVGLD